MSEKWDLRPRTLKVGPKPKTKDPCYTWDLWPQTQDTESRAWDPHDLLSNVELKNYDPKKLNQMTLKHDLSHNFFDP